MSADANHLSSDVRLTGDFYTRQSAIVAGQVLGEFTAEGPVKVLAGGRLEGIITVGALELAPGAWIKGILRVLKKKTASTPTKEAYSPGKETLTRGLEGLTKFALGKK